MHKNIMLSPVDLSLSTILLLLLLISPPLSSRAQFPLPSPSPDEPPTVCIIGSGIGGSSVAHFLRYYSSNPFSIRIFERHGVVGGRMAMVNVSGETFEAGASILHPKNFHAVNYTKLLDLKIKKPSSSESFSLGIWDGKTFVFKTLKGGCKVPFVDKIVSLANSVLMFVRYGFSLLRMESFVEVCLLFKNIAPLSYFCLLGEWRKRKKFFFFFFLSYLNAYIDCQLVTFWYLAKCFYCFALWRERQKYYFMLNWSANKS